MLKNSEIIQILKNLDIKVTEPRVLIASILLKSSEHMDVDEVLTAAKKKNSRIGIATVYRVLKLLEDANLIRKDVFSNGMISYENTYNKEYHEHIVDLESKTVSEFSSPKLEKLLKSIAAENGYEMISHDIKIYAKKK